MRDINRIDDFCDNLKKQWKRYPEYRFGQMMMNVFSDMVKDGRDPFFPEETEMLKYITAHFDSMFKHTNNL